MKTLLTEDECMMFARRNSCSSGGCGGPAKVVGIMRKKRGWFEVEANAPAPSSSASSSDVVSRSLDVALGQGTKFVSVPKLPWETGFLRDVLGTPGSFAPPWLTPLIMPRDLPLVYAEPIPLTLDISEKKMIVRNLYHERTAVGLDDKRKAALARWVDLVLLHPQESRLGQLLLACVGQQDCEQTIAKLVEDWLARKSTSTLALRASSLALYVAFVRKYAGDVAIVPIDETMVYSYIDFLRDSQKPPTRAQTFVSTLSFMSHVFGWQGAEDAANSQRVQGAAHLCFLRKRVLRQAPPLDVIAIVTLEICCMFASDNFLRGRAGLCLVALYGRLRVSDCGRISHGRILGDYFEGSLCRVKTARTLEKQTRFLPLIVPVHGLLGFPWFQMFLDARDMLGLDPIPEDAPDTTADVIVLFPSLASLMSGTLEKLGAAEMTERLGECLGKILPKEAYGHYTSHSLKCTLLTFTNIFGMTLEQNELLGYHVVKGHSSAINYSRDVLASPIRAMMTMLDAIKRGTFRPLALRGQQFVDRAKAVDVRTQFTKCTGYQLDEAAGFFVSKAAMECEDTYNLFCEMISLLQESAYSNLDVPCNSSNLLLPESQLELESEASDNESSSSDSCSTSAEEGMAAVEEDLLGKQSYGVNPHADIDRMYRHVRTKMLHFAHADDMRRTCCGRAVGDTFTIFNKDPELAWPKCRICFGK